MYITGALLTVCVVFFYNNPFPLYCPVLFGLHKNSS